MKIVDDIIERLRIEISSGPSPEFGSLLKHLKQLDPLKFHEILPELMQGCSVSFKNSVILDCTFVFNIVSEWDRFEDGSEEELLGVFSQLSGVILKLNSIPEKLRYMKNLIYRMEQDRWAMRLVNKASTSEEATLLLAGELARLEASNNQMREELAQIEKEIRENRAISRENIDRRRKARHPEVQVLNDSQREVIEMDEGRILITAGPGSGKTRVLTERAVQLVKDGCIPERILILTFTVKATHNLVTRVDKALSDYDGRPVIRNFHSFCKEMIEGHFQDFGFSETPRHIDDHVLNYLLKQRAVSLPIGENDELKSLLETSKFRDLVQKMNELLHNRARTPQSTLEICKEIAQEEDDDGEGDGRLELAILALEETIELRNILKEMNGITFGDQITLVHERMIEDPVFVQSLVSRFDHLMVDEFQDNNFAQGNFVSLLADHLKSTAVVGDEDQAIFHWRGANVGNMREFKEKFEEHDDFHHVNLDIGYRHSQKIVETAEKYISHDVERIKTEPMQSGWISDEVTKIDAFRYASDIDEAGEITEFIRRRHLLGIEYDEMAILARSLNYVRQIIHQLEMRGIPFSTTDSSNLFNDELTREIGLLVRVCLDPIGQGHALAKLLDSELFSLDLEDVMILRRRTRPTQRLFGNMVKMNGKFQNKTAINTMHDFIENNSFNRSDVRLWMHEMMRDSGVAECILRSSDPMKATALINRLATQLQNAMDFLEEPEYLAEFVEIFMDVGIELEVEQVQLPGSILVTTIHKAKGLEWPIVIMPSLVERKRRPPEENEKIVAEVKSILFPDENEEEEVRKEERRVFFVGLTRVEELLHLSAVYWITGATKERIPLSLFNDAGISLVDCETIYPSLAGYGLGAEMALRYGLRHRLEASMKSLREGKEIDDIKASLRGMISFQINNYLVEGNMMDMTLHQFIDEVESLIGPITLEEYHLESTTETIDEPSILSWSGLSTYMRCPLKYRWQYELRLKGSPSKPMKIGIFVHEVIEEFSKKHLGSNENKHMDEIIESVLNKYVNTLPIFSPGDLDEMRKWLDEWQQSEHQCNDSRKVTHIEEEIEFEFHEVKFRGKIDRVEEDEDGRLTLIDFKTTRSKKMKKPGAEGGQEQLLLYAFAWHQIHGRMPDKVSLNYVSKGKESTVEIEPLMLKRELGNLVEPIELLMAGDRTPNKGHCRWCDLASICPERA